MFIVTLSVVPSTWLNVIVSLLIEDDVYKEPEIPSRLAILLSSVVNLVESELDKAFVDPDSSLIDAERELDSALIELENEAEYCSAFNE